MRGLVSTKCGVVAVFNSYDVWGFTDPNAPHAWQRTSKDMMVELHVVVGITIGPLAGWFCTRSPLWLAKFIDRNVTGDVAKSFRLQRNREFAAYVREHPNHGICATVTCSWLYG